MKKWTLFILILVLIPFLAAAEQEVQLQESRFRLTLPDWMTYEAPMDKDLGVHAYTSNILEMDYSVYPKAEAVRQGMPETLLDTAKSWVNQGRDAELRRVNGIEMLCFRVIDEADGTPCIAYVFEDTGWLIEISFWYATQEAADLTAEIMTSIH